jgi:hypothetical protein
MTKVESKVEETQETQPEAEPKVVKQDAFDPREWSRRAAGAYKHTTLVDNVHLPEINRPKLIPVKEFFESHCEYFNETNGVPGVRAVKDISGGGLIEECHYWVLESRLNDFIKGTKDKIGVRLLWTIDCTEEETYKCDELGPHVIIPRGNAMSYNISDTPNAYFSIDEVTRTIRFYALRPISKGETITVSRPSEESLGFNGITATEFREISGMNMAIPGDPAKKGCSSCQEKKKFRERSV